MNQVTQILSGLERGNPEAAERLLPLVYDALRKLAAQRLAQEKPGQTLQATALVHEAYLRPVDVEEPQRWQGRGHFFAAAAEAMRRILLEAARHRRSVKAGGGKRRVELDEIELPDGRSDEELLALDDALGELEKHDPRAAQLVKLRYFVGLAHQEAAEALLAFALRDVGRLDEAERMLQKALRSFEIMIEKEPANVEHWHFLADTYRRAGGVEAERDRPVPAERAFRRAMEVHDQRMAKFPGQHVNDWEWAATYADLARLLLKAGRLDDAAPLAARALEIDPSDPGFKKLLAELDEKRK